MKKAKKKSQKELRKELVSKFEKAVLEASQAYGKSPSLVTAAEYNEFAELSEWELRKLGGYNNLKKIVFPASDKDLATSSEHKRIKSYVNRLEKQLGNQQAFEKRVTELVENTLKNLPKKKIAVKKRSPQKGKKKMTVELMLSDIHYGKKTEDFDLATCRSRMNDLVDVFLKEVEIKEKAFNVEKVIIALIGDIIESYTMHSKESALSCEFSNPMQMVAAIESLYYDVILPIAKTGKEIVIPCITGNHDRHDPKKTYNNPGLNNLSFVIYKSIKMLAESNGLKNVEFIIPEGSYTILDVYGSNILYEHGDELKSTAKNVIQSHMEKRGRQEGKMVHMSRFGHWHEYVCYDRGAIIINESVCGQDSYALVKGYNSTAGQTINYYVDTKDRPSSFYYSFPVYLG